MPAHPKMCIRDRGRNPVQNYTDGRSMAAVDKIGKVFGGAEAGGRRKIAGNLIAPRAVIGKFGDGHQFNMGVMHRNSIRHQFLCHLSVVKAHGFLLSLLFGAVSYTHLDVYKRQGSAHSSAHDYVL